MTVICPQCKFNQEVPHGSFTDPGDHFWCIRCGQMLIFGSNSVLRCATETDWELYAERNDSRNEQFFLPTLKQSDVSFNIVILIAGTFNPFDYDYNFAQQERLLKHIYLKTGIMPLAGDFVKGNNAKTNAEVSFVIVGRQYAIDDYDEWSLFVVPERTWLEKTSW